jgi:aspartate/methionine/tyrosine aminotransferase
LHHHADGKTELRQTIANLYQDRTPDNVMLTNGSAEANFIMLMSLLQPGDELIVVVPNYMQIDGWAKALDVKVIEVALHQDNDWLPDFTHLDALVTDKTKMLTICHPNNPTGSTLPIAQIEQLVEFAKRHDIYLHADEVYKRAEFNDVELPSFADLYDKAIVTCGLSKAMCMAWTVILEWALAHPPNIYGLDYSVLASMFGVNIYK